MCVFGFDLSCVAFLVLAFLFFFFFFFSCVLFCFVLQMLTFCSEQCTYALFTDPQITLFSNFFIKNGSHGTIHTFKNYFATVFSVFSFQFQQNKFYPNTPCIAYRTYIYIYIYICLNKTPICHKNKKYSEKYKFFILKHIEHVLNVFYIIFVQKS